VADRYGSLAVGPRARYYSALCEIELGEREKAESILRELAERQRAGEAGPGLAELALARIEQAPGKSDQAIARYGKLVDQQSKELPRDYVLMSLATALEDAGRFSEAAANFRRVVDEMPASPFADEARSRADYLKARGREVGRGEAELMKRRNVWLLVGAVAVAAIGAAGTGAVVLALRFRGPAVGITGRSAISTCVLTARS